MMGVRSISRDLVQQKVQEKEYQKHQQRIQNIISNKTQFLDNQYDQVKQSNHYQSKINSNRFRYDQDQNEIRYCNEILSDKIYKLKTEAKINNLQRSYVLDTTANNTTIVETGPPHTLNYNYRKQQSIKIAKENNEMGNRLKNITPCIDTDQILKETAKYLDIRKRCQNYDYFPSPFKSKIDPDTNELVRIESDEKQYRINIDEQNNSSLQNSIQKSEQHKPIRTKKSQNLEMPSIKSNKQNKNKDNNVIKEKVKEENQEEKKKQLQHLYSEEQYHSDSKSKYSEGSYRIKKEKQEKKEKNLQDLKNISKSTIRSNKSGHKSEKKSEKSKNSYEDDFSDKSKSQSRNSSAKSKKSVKSAKSKDSKKSKKSKDSKHSHSSDKKSKSSKSSKKSKKSDQSKKKEEGKNNYSECSFEKE